MYLDLRYIEAYEQAKLANMLRGYRCRRCDKVTSGPPSPAPFGCGHCRLTEWHEVLPEPIPGPDAAAEMRPGVGATRVRPWYLE